VKKLALLYKNKISHFGLKNHFTYCHRHEPILQEMNLNN